jgi:hypothetical protein
MHKLPLARTLVQLGIAYELSADAAFLSLSIDPSRIAKLMERGREMIASFTPPARVSREALESFKGLFRHCTQLSPQFNHLVRPLDKWTDEDFFSRHIRDVKQRRALKTTLLLLLSCVPHAQNMVMRAADFDLPFVHIYTDASLDNVRELNAVLGRGQRRDLDRFNIFIGGMLVRQDGTSEAFRTQLTRLPPDSDSCHIGVIETLAVRAAASVFRKDLAHAYSIFHVDNLGAVHCLVKNSSSCRFCQSIGGSFSKFMMKNKFKFWIAWISTLRNLSDVLTRSERFQLILDYFPNTVFRPFDQNAALRAFLWSI